ncbi:hypothetical protein [Salipiger abyssi]|uniref:Response regulatory domain-containing protein n=1 Tax=Salipiger abyssi TaxID=1250539 RepID=A0A1P8UUM2_9RHOB|nr:hypothetical protein [Salipiger abyssi]APZ53095.1 hypothetical protein Ga0080574_TMP2761 [Salipiger abyssi]
MAEDIATTLGETYPGARIECVQDRDAAMAVLSELPRVEMAIVALTPEEAQTSDLGRALSDRQARIALMGIEAEDHGEASGFAVLHRPFRTADLLAMLRVAGR